MKKSVKKTVSLSMAAVLVVGTAFFATMNGSTKTVNAENADTEKKIQDTIENSVNFTQIGSDKEETVYVISDANGKVQKTIVSDWLKNKENAKTITDKSDLKDIKNVKSDAEYKENSDGTIEWAADGNDIYYQGTTDKELPVDVKVTYLLDGKEVKAADLAGKSGKLTIRFSYTNNQKKSVTINGTATEMYVPFTMISGMVLPTDKFTNVQINSGKVITDGNNAIVVGLAFPGMNSNLNLASVSSDKTLTFPEEVEVTADVKDFSLMMTLTMGSADLLSTVNTDNMKSLDDVKTVVDKLVESTNALSDGASKLKDGLGTLLGKMDPLTVGVTSLSSGIYEINSGVSQLSQKSVEFVQGLKSALDGTNTLLAQVNGENGAINGANKLAAGAAQVDAGLGQLSANVSGADESVSSVVSQLASGANAADQAVDEILAGFENNKDEKGLTDGSKDVADGVAQVNQTLQEKAAKLQATFNENNDKINQLTALVKGGVNPQTKAPLSTQEIATYTANINQLAGANAALKEVLDIMTSTEITGKLDALSAGATRLVGGIQKLKDGIKEYKNTASLPLAAGLGKLNSKMPELTQGIAALKDGSSQLKDGTAQLAGGMTQLSDAVSKQLQPGLSQLYDGGVLLSSSLGKLYEGTQAANKGSSDLLSATGQLKDGVSQLSDGATTLSDGMNQFKSEGVDKITNVMNGSLEEVIERIKSTLSLAKDYRIYSNAADGKDTSVKFIYKTEEISADK